METYSREANIIKARENYRRKHDHDGSQARYRADERNARSAGQQMALLDERLGRNVGATKERARLHAQLGV